LYREFNELRFPAHHGKDFKLWSVDIKIEHGEMWGRQQTLKLETFA